MMERLSSPLDQLEAHYDVVVIGSGYGGSIAACRLSRAGRRVAVLERGRELHPGEYPRTAEAAARHLQTTEGQGSVGDPRNLYWFHVGGDMCVFSGCGLGGTSLVNANVALRPDPRVFEDGRWPLALREDPSGLTAGYERAEAMLAPTPYPDSFPPLAKVAALRSAAGDDPVAMTPINVTFRAGPNAAGVHQEPCTGCGDCVTGCNYWAKNTVLMNYLPDAVAHGARIFTEVDVRWVERGSVSTGSRPWVVRAQPLGLERDQFHAPPLAVTADLVVVAGGTLGSVWVLLQSAEHGLGLSGQVGRHFSGNGDVLAFSYRSNETVRGIGAGPARPDSDRPAGPCITAVIDRRAGRPLAEGTIIEDAVVPGAVAGLLPVELLGQLAPGWLRGRVRRGGPIAGLVSLLTGGGHGMTERLQTLLMMGNDDDEGSLELDGDGITVRWPGGGTSAYYEMANRTAAEVASRNGGTFLHDPLWSRLLHHDLITVHPIGGCVMADRAEDGVVDDRGRVFSGPAGDEVYDGLVVWDGSIVSRPLGVNPLLTISALTERAVAWVAAEHGWSTDETRAAPAPDGGGGQTPPSRPGLRFTERMTGWWSPTDTPDAGESAQYEEAAREGELAGTPLTFELTLSSDDLVAEVADLARTMTAVGTVEAPALSGDPLTVNGGTFQLLAPDDEAEPEIRHMWYRLGLVATDGRRLHFAGFKRVGPGDVRDAWPATTTLYVTLRDGDPAGGVVGRGVLRIRPEDFARQLRTMTVTGPAGERERLDLERRFGLAFAGALYDEFGSVVQRTTRFNPSAPPRRRRPLDLPPAEVLEYRSGDGVPLRLAHYAGGSRGPVLLVHGMGANPLTYLLDTVETNLAEYLVAHGFDVWVQEWRGSTLLESSHSQFTADTVARLDHRAVQAAVREHSGRSDLHVVAHCVGSLTWVMATLAGAATPSSLLCSSVGGHPVGPPITRFKVGLHLGEFLRRLGVGTLTTDTAVGESRPARLFDLALRAYPIPHAEQCDQAVCHRLAFIYGVAVHHPNMNDLTHGTMHELFGPTDMTMMCHLSRMARAEKLVDARGQDVYLPHLERLDLPLTLVSGAQNLVWIPESTARDHEQLVAAFGGARARRVVVDGYGHQDFFIGAASARRHLSGGPRASRPGERLSGCRPSGSRSGRRAPDRSARPLPGVLDPEFDRVK